MFSLVQHHKYGIQDIEQLYPFERDVYYGLLIQHIEELEAESQG